MIVKKAQAGGDAGQQDSGDETATGLDEAATKQVATMVNEAVNGAVTSHLTRFKKSMGEDLAQAIQAALGPVGKQLEALAAAGSQQGEAAQGKSKGDSGVPNDVKNMLAAQEGRIKEQEKQIQDLLAGNKAEREAREAEQRTRLAGEERSAIANHLRAKGWADPSIRAAVAILHTEDKRVGRNDAGEIVYRQTKGTGAAQYVEEAPYDKGLDAWLSSDEGKSLTPARPVQGSGAGTVRAGQTQQQGGVKQNATNVLAAALLGIGDGGG